MCAFCHALQEIGTIPRMQQEVGELWYAGSRLAYCTLSARCWSTDCPHGHYMTLLTRVTEKTGLWSCYCLDFIVDKLLAMDAFKNCSMVHLISDCGTHFRCCRTLAHAGYMWFTKHRKLQRVVVTFGLEAHWKTEVDGHFGWQSMALKEAETKRDLITIADLKDAFEQQYRDTAGDSDRWTMDVFDFMPDVAKSEYPTCLYKTDSLPSPIKSCHHWSFRRADKRQKNLVGNDDVTITGVWCRAHGVPGASAGEDRTVHVLLDRDSTSTVGDEVDLDGESKMLASEVGVAVKEFMGWRTSYRSECPEDLLGRESQILARVKAKDRAMHTLSRVLPETASVDYRRRPSEQEARATAKRAARGKARRAADAACRRGGGDDG